jgi:hypothetical protein
LRTTWIATASSDLARTFILKEAEIIRKLAFADQYPRRYCSDSGQGQKDSGGFSIIYFFSLSPNGCGDVPESRTVA